MKLGPGIVYYLSICYDFDFADGSKFVQHHEIKECEILDKIVILTISEEEKLTIPLIDFISHNTKIKNNKIECAGKEDLEDLLKSKESGDIVAIGYDNSDFTIARKK